MQPLAGKTVVVGGGTGSVHAAVACLGGWYYGYSMHRMPFTDWERVLQDNLTTHFLFMRAFVSMLHEQGTGTYVMVNGGASEVVAPEAGAISISVAAQRMMAKVLADEARKTDIRVHSVIAFHPVKTRDRKSEAEPQWLTPEELGGYICRLVAGAARQTNEIVHTLRTSKDL